ncbi:MAG: hypothetical protein NW241_20545 [Bacteroidia bacterium]|nr:hypothetical protein [Bacteroidia bacterium]
MKPAPAPGYQPEFADTEDLEGLRNIAPFLHSWRPLYLFVLGELLLTIGLLYLLGRISG